MRGPNRPRKPGRLEPYRDPRPIVLIVCEGEETEKQYFLQFARHHKNARIQVKVADETGVPFSLVEFAKRFKSETDKRAKRLMDENISYDSVWCVFDFDEHPRIPDAKVMAADHNISLAISNPCFELWLYLHLKESPGMQHRHVMQDLLEDLAPGYGKHVNFAIYAPGYTQAVRRAQRLATMANNAGTPGHNPTSNVYELTELILKGRDEGQEEPFTHDTATGN